MNTQLIKQLEEDIKELKKQPMANYEDIERIERKVKGLKENIELTEDQILKDIELFRHKWITDTDWWFGSTTGFKNAPLGYDINIAHEEESKKIEAIIYALVPSKEDNGHLEISKDTLFKFEIEIEPISWEQGEILTPITIEDGAPFELSQNYLITKVEEQEREKRTVKVYTLNDRCDFRYSDFEISAYFKKAVLS